MESIVESIASENIVTRKNALEQLLIEFRKENNSLLVPNPSRFFTVLRDRLEDHDWEILSQVLQLLQDLIPNFGPDLESNFIVLMPNLVQLLQDQRPGIAKSSLNVISAYVRTTRNMETAMSYILKYGLQSEEWRLKHQTLQIVIPIIKLDLSYTANIPEMKKIFERVIAMIKDTSGLVSQSAKEVALGLKDLAFDFNAIFSKITPGYQQIYNESCEEIKGNSLLRNNLQKEIFSPIKSFLEKPDKRTSAFAFQSASIGAIANAMSQGNSSDLFKESSKNGLVFGFIPPNLMVQLEDISNWRARVNAIEELENLVERMENYTEAYPFMAVFIRFLNKLLDDTNFKVMLSTLAIVYTIVSIPGISQQANISQIVPGCIKKLGDNKIAIRQAAFKVFQALLQEMKPRVLFPHLIESLSSNNWHVREETIIVMIAAILLAKEDYEFNFSTLIGPLAKLLDDPKTKIRFVTTEALALLAQKLGVDTVNDELAPIVDNAALESLQKRFRCKFLPSLKDNYVEFPKTIPSSAPLISSPYLTTTDFSRTTVIGGSMDPTPRKESPDVTNPNIFSSSANQLKYSRLRMSSESGDETLPRIKNEANLLRKGFILEKKKAVNLRTEFDKPPTGPIKLNYASRYIAKESPIKAMGPLHRRGISEENENSFEGTQSSPTLITKLNSADLTGQKTESLINQKAYPSAENFSSTIKSEFSNSDVIYLKPNELEPLDDPEDALKRCVLSGRSDDWNECFETINVLRRLLKHHPGVFLSQVTLHNLFLDVVKWAESLRSALCKNAIIVLGEMAEHIGRNLDGEIPDFVKIIMKKVVDTSSFIQEQTDQTLVSMCMNLNENKLASALLNNTQSARNSLVKAKTAFCFGKIFERLRASIIRLREVEKIIQLLGTYISDASPEVRASAREALNILSSIIPSAQEHDRLLANSLTDNTYRKVKENTKQKEKIIPLKKKHMKSEIKMPLNQTDNFRMTSPRKQELETDPNTNPEENDIIVKMLDEMNDNEWKMRHETVGKLGEMVAENPNSFKKSQKMIPLISILAKGLSDPNLKVNIHALGVMIKIIPPLNHTLEPHLGMVIGSLLPSLGSANSSIREIAKEVVSTLLKYADHHTLLLPFIAAIPNANNRSKSSLLNFIIETIPKVSERRPQLIQKHVVPLMFRCMDEPKADVREETNRLVKKVYDLLGSALLESAPSSKLQRIMDILNEGM
ncbi:unnamed protein product [Blepharisma stoltei]|uniref:TOG domain-containing protein n=1 Tax=Blepharisma stoltei TaxID=1481888 RepID=A0AAU9JK98_9CILI|nr:unnamed protein product [Blepharisma stoltei]